MGRERRGGCLGQSCENSDLWNSLFSKRKIPTLEQSMKERDLVSPKWPVSPQAASSLVDESSGWKISGKFSSSEFSCNNFHTLCGKFKIMRVFKQLLEDTESDQIQGEAMGNLTLHSGATWLSHVCGLPLRVCLGCAQAEIHRDLSVRGWSLGAARKGRYWWRTPTEGHEWEHEQFCIKTPFKSLDDPGIAVSKGSRGDVLEGWISWSEISAVALSSKDRILDSSPPSSPLKY